MIEDMDGFYALKIYNRRLRLVIDLVVRLLDALERGGMFLPPDALPLISVIRKQITQLDVVIAGSREICEE